MAGAGLGSLGAGAVAPAAATASSKTASTPASATKVDQNSLVDQLLKKHPPATQSVSLNVVTPASAANSPASSGHIGTNINTSA